MAGREPRADWKAEDAAWYAERRACGKPWLDPGDDDVPSHPRAVELLLGKAGRCLLRIAGRR